MELKFFKDIYNEDVIYHYSKTSTAIDFILFNHELKFGVRKNSIDPIESCQPDRRTSFSGIYVDLNIDKKVIEESNALNNHVTNLENTFLQISFCKNHIEHEFASPFYDSQFKGHEELFGFTKSRMWERYAENYSGVCIAFSKTKILALNKQTHNLIYKDVKYLKYSELACKKVDNISGNNLLKEGYDMSKERINQRVEESFFCKHTDYAGENEFRIGTYFDEEKCTLEEINGTLHFNKTMMLNVKDCIKAIFISSYANPRQKISLLEYAEKLQIPIIEMVWKHNSFEPKDYKKSIEFFKNLPS